MTVTTSIEIDLDAYKRLEGKRQSFQETHSDIIRRLSGEPPFTDSKEKPGPLGGPPYKFSLNGKTYTENTLKAFYLSVLERLKEFYPNLYEELAEVKFRSRMVIAKVPEDLYLKTPSLAKAHALELAPGWWVDTNLSATQVIERIKAAEDVCGLTGTGRLKTNFGPKS